MSVLRGTFYLGLSRVLSLLLNVWAIGKYVSWLGNEGWGAIVLCIVLCAICNTVADLGLGNGSINAMVKAHDVDDQLAANRILATHSTISLLMSFVVAIPFAVCYFTNYIKVVHQDQFGVLFYTLTAATVVLVLVSYGQNAALVSRREYSFIALIGITTTVINTAVSLYLVYTYRHPFGFMAGNFAGALVTVATYEWRTRRIGFGGARFGLFWKEFESVVVYAKRSWLTNSAQLVGGLDRVVLNAVLGQARLGIYDQSVRIPATLTSTMPLAQVFPAEIAKVNLEGPAALDEAYWKVFPATLALMMAVLVIPSAFAESYLRLIFKSYDPVMTSLFVLASIDAASSIYGSLFAIFSNATARPQLVAPFVWFMLLGSALVAYPAATAYGLVGVAAARVMLQFVQFYLLEWATKKYLIPTLDIKLAISKKLIIVALTAVFWVIGYRIFDTLKLAHLPFVSIGISACLSYVFMLILVATKVVRLPKKLESILPRFART